MKNTIQLLIVSFLLTFQATYAQRGKINVSAERKDDKSVVFSYTKDVPGTHTLFVDFTKLENSNATQRKIELRGNSGRLFTLNPVNSDRSINYAYRTTYIRGEIDHKLDKDITYVLPTAKSEHVQVEHLNNLNEVYLDGDRPENWTAFLIRSERQDTIRAMRKGVVVSIVDKHDIDPELRKNFTSDRNTVMVEHPDGSFAKYGAFEKDEIFVELGDTVYPHSKIGLTEEYNIGEYRTYFLINYRVIEDDDNGKERFAWAYVNPYFHTEKGRIQLMNRHSYLSTMNPEILQSEFSRREKKQFKKNPEKFGL